uniref:Uncharacterized protein n=1 Tax=Trichuris muris TaxID=70415 RepID=A0A5S6QY10_TRIMR
MEQRKPRCGGADREHNAIGKHSACKGNVEKTGLGCLHLFCFRGITKRLVLFGGTFGAEIGGGHRPIGSVPFGLLWALLLSRAPTVGVRTERATTKGTERDKQTRQRRPNSRPAKERCRKCIPDYGIGVDDFFKKKIKTPSLDKRARWAVKPEQLRAAASAAVRRRWHVVVGAEAVEPCLPWQKVTSARRAEANRLKRAATLESTFGPAFLRSNRVNTGREKTSPSVFHCLPSTIGARSWGRAASTRYSRPPEVDFRSNKIDQRILVERGTATG